MEYTAGYLADHRCQKGHIVYGLEGELIHVVENGTKYILKQGMSYLVSEEMGSHRSRTNQPAKLLIVDGDFLQ